MEDLSNRTADPKADEPSSPPVLEYGHAPPLSERVRRRMPRLSPRTMILIILCFFATWWLWRVRKPWLMEHVIRNGIAELRNTLSPDGNLALTSNGWRFGTPPPPTIWSTRTGEVLARLYPGPARITGAEFNSTGTRLITHEPTSEIQLWDTRSGMPLRELTVTGEKPLISFSPDGRRIASRTQAQVKLLDAADGHLIAQLIRPDEKNSYVGPVVFCNQSVLAVMLPEERCVKLFNTRTGKLDLACRIPAYFSRYSGSMYPSGEAIQFELTHDASRLLVGNPTGLWLIDLSNGKTIWSSSRKPWIKRVMFSPDERKLLLWENKKVQVVDPTTGNVTASVTVTNSYLSKPPSFSRNGKWIWNGGRTILSWPGLKSITLPPVTFGYSGASFSPDGRTVLLQSAPRGIISHSVEIWDLYKGRPVAELKLNSEPYRSITDFRFFPQGQRLALQTGMGDVWIFQKNRPYGILGLFALPQLYLLGLLLAASMYSARMDRRNQLRLIAPPCQGRS